MFERTFHGYLTIFYGPKLKYPSLGSIKMTLYKPLGFAALYVRGAAWITDWELKTN